MYYKLCAVGLSLSFVVGCGKHSGSKDRAGAKLPQNTSESGQQPETPDESSQNSSGSIGSGSSNGNEQVPNAEPTVSESKTSLTVTCDQKWSEYVAVNAVGKFLKYSTTTISKFGGRESKVESTSTQTVTTSNADLVEIGTLTSSNGQNFESKSTTERAKFIEGCETPSEVANQPLEKGEEQGVEVPAGKFDTHWAIYQHELGTTKTRIKSWIASFESGESILVKSETNSEMTSGSSTSTTELVGTNRNVSVDDSGSLTLLFSQNTDSECQVQCSYNYNYCKARCSYPYSECYSGCDRYYRECFQGCSSR